MTSTTAFNLAGETALITGGATGLGLAIARSFVASGAQVVTVGRRATELQKAVAELGPNASWVSHDVTNHAAAGELVAAAIKAAGAPPASISRNPPWTPPRKSSPRC
jgi:NAD(P)-dependent dehydrogenase (short-subunit alcohol dehydrogenase family)